MEPTVKPEVSSEGSDSHDTINVGETAGALALAVWVLFSNLVLIMAILRSEHRRKVSFNLHVCNLSVAGLVMGGFVLTLYIDFCINGRWMHDDMLCRIWLMADIMVCTVSVLAIGTMIFDRFVLFSCPLAAEGCCKFVLSATLIILPWALSVSLVLPLYWFGETGDGIRTDYGVCYLHMKAPFGVALELGGYAVPALAAFGLLVATSLTWCVKREELRELDYSAEREHKGWQLITSWLVCTAVLAMWFPFSALHLLTYMMDKSWPEEWMTFAIWLAYANSGVNPLLWMVMPRIRHSVVSLFCCCCCCWPCCKEKRNRRRMKKRYEDDETRTAMIEFREK